MTKQSGIQTLFFPLCLCLDAFWVRFWFTSEIYLFSFLLRGKKHVFNVQSLISSLQFECTSDSFHIFLDDLYCVIILCIWLDHALLLVPSACKQIKNSRIIPQLVICGWNSMEHKKALRLKQGTRGHGNHRGGKRISRFAFFFISITRFIFCASSPKNKGFEQHLYVKV